MKAIASLVAALAVICLPLQAPAQELNGQSVVVGQSTIFPASGGPGGLSIPGLHKAPPSALTNRSAFRIPAPRRPQAAPSPTRPLPVARPPAPGVYETTPYTCIVVVPGAHPDDKICVGGPGLGTVGRRMPIIKPDLQFIPRKQ